jgi:SAM-dependent methyltransferase
MAYEGLAQVYDELMADMPYDRWLAFTLEGWRRYGRPGRVADLGCGTGNLTVALAGEGVHVTGIDLSPDMLAIARDKWETLKGDSGGEAMFLEQDVRFWTLPEPVECAVSYCDTLNYLLEGDDVRQAFRQTFSQLKPGGLFLFDMHAPARLREYAHNQPYMLDDDRISYLWTCEWDEERLEIEHAITLFVRAGDGDLYRRIEECHRQRAYEREFVVRELKAAGFGEIHAAADFDWNKPADSSARRWFFAAVK